MTPREIKLIGIVLASLATAIVALTLTVIVLYGRVQTEERLSNLLSNFSACNNMVNSLVDKVFSHPPISN